MILPKLRVDLDIMLSPVTDRPGLLIRDRFRYSDTTLIIPPSFDTSASVVRWDANKAGLADGACSFPGKP